MKILLKSCRVIEPGKLNRDRKDILISAGKIESIVESGSNLQADKIISSSDLCVSPGWFDFRADFCEPGKEHKEDLMSGSRAASAGGFTSVLISSSTEPAVDSKSLVEFISNTGKRHSVNLYPSGTITEKREGKKLAEMYDMKRAGALAFSDGKRSVKDAGLLMRAMQYATGINALVMNFPMDQSIAGVGKVHEGIHSTSLGLKGIPAIAEELMVARDLRLLEFTGGKLHISCISSEGSLRLIREAKKKGLNVTCDVAAHQLYLDDSYLETFDSNYKVMPPIRSRDDLEALRAGVLDGTIDIICSDHTPQDIESKLKEFDIADYGIAGIESFFSIVCTSIDKDPSEYIHCFTQNPRKILGLNECLIKQGESAELTIFDPTMEAEYRPEQRMSKSANNPFYNIKLKGKVLGTINGTISQLIN